jgi:hypothetical protein
MSDTKYYLQDNYGFLVRHPVTEEIDHYARMYKKWKKYNDVKMDHQRTRWKRIENQFDLSNVKKLDLKKLIRKGIPPDYRGVIWFNISGAATKKSEYPDLFDRLRKCTTTTPVTMIIDKDIKRTFPEHPTFNKTSLDDLKDVLYAYSFYNEKIGYCQAMNYVAGGLLLNMPAEEAFWTLVVMLEDYLPSDLYDDRLSGLKQELHCLSEMYRQINPKTYKFIQSKDCDFAMFASQWFMSLFVDSMPIDTVFRIWDVLFSEGCETLHRVAIARLNHSDLQKCNHVGEIMNMLRGEGHVLFDCRMLMKQSYSVKRIHKEKLIELRQKYRSVSK